MKKLLSILIALIFSGSNLYAQYGTNLVTNPDAESGFTGWTVTNGGSGWGFWGGAGTYSWGSSFNWCTLEQTIDLSLKGYQASALDVSPNILVGVQVSNSGAAGAYAVQYEFKVELLNSSDAVVTSWTTGEITTAINTPDWVPLSHTFSSYATGVRKVKITLRGQDYTVDWAGQYGAGFDNVNVQVDGPLPVELTSFTANTTGSAITLHWRTATEVNNYGFEIERRLANNEQQRVINWQKIGFANGSGTSNSPKVYSYLDATASAGRYVYRLKQIDNDGTFKYSQSVEVSTQALETFALEQNYPNPFNPTTEIKFGIVEESFVTLIIYDMLGRTVATLVRDQLSPGMHSATFNANGLSSGIYIYRLSAGNFVETKRMILMK